jgi:hypothetical protein
MVYLLVKNNRSLITYSLFFPLETPAAAAREHSGWILLEATSNTSGPVFSNVVH